MASGKLGSAALAAAADTLIYTVPDGKVATLNIACANRDSVSAKVRIAIGVGANPTNDDYVQYDTSLAGNGVIERTGIVCGAGEKVWVRSDIANVSVRVHGFEE
ncbi:MAG: hypothetical protein U0989_02455 [Azonexus sp.]|nr:hypothetical protein [Azonexus sp.]MDZ4313627.1 hypothetical protein [Azonexus sp.]